MRISEIELDNFKSFGKRTVIPILPGFTTISGPNGAGKSNVVDSLLFALGLSSTRSMRAERLPDLLNNLSGKNEASVTVRFKTETGLDADETIEVTRRIRVKDNGYNSTYFLNGKVVTLTEIHEELSKYNVSPHGFNVIMQGDVTGIVSMGAVERRKIIDELAGVAEFDRRISQANDELLSVGEKIEQQRIIVAEIEGRMEVLRNDRDQALKYLDLKNQKEEIERDLVFTRTREVEEAAQKELAQLEELKQREESLLANLQAHEVELLSLRAQMGSLDQEIRDKGGNEVLLIRQELENQRGELTREQNKLSNLDGSIAEKTKVVKQLQAQIKTIDKHLLDLSREKKINQDESQRIADTLSMHQGNLQSVLSEIEALRKKKDQSTDKLTSLHEGLQKLREEKHGLTVRKTELATRRQGLEHEQTTIRDSAASNISKSASLKAQLQQLERQHQDSQATAIGIERGIRQVEGEIESTRQEIENKRQELEAVKQNLVKLETHAEVAGESGYGKAVEAVLASGIQGVHGTIGQLGQVRKEYELAIETAIGPRLSHLVVETDEVAHECIEYLKRTHAGRATFVPLNKIAVQPPGLLPSRPGVIDFAYNLVNFNQRFAKAFQYACGQTIVVDTMDNARKLLTQARIVTFDGELFEKSGSMTGGKDTRSKVHFANQGKTDLAALKLKAQALAEDIKWLQKNLGELTEGLKHDRNQLSGAQTVVARHNAELATMKKEIQEIDSDIDTAKPRLRSNGDEIENIDQEVTQIDQKLAGIEKKIEQLQDELSGTTGGPHASAIEKLIKRAEDLQAEVEASEDSLKEAQRQIDRIETEERLELSNRQALDEQLTGVSGELDNAESERPLYEKRIEGIQATIAELEDRASRVGKELEELHKAKEELHEKVTQIEVKRTQANDELSHMSELQEAHKQAHAGLYEELGRLKAQIEEILAEKPDYEPPSQGTVDHLKQQVERLERRMRALEPVNMKALEEYNHTEQRLADLNHHLETLSNEKEEIQQRITGYDELKRRTFMEAFEKIDANFHQIFAELSHGTGKLELEDKENPFNGGLIIRAQPRDKKMQRIEALSGGEKSLTALAFVFAFQRYAPAPFYAFDEVDMMLDGFNAEQLARMVKRESDFAQFVVVSLRRPMIENSDHAIGVSLRPDGFSRVVGISEVQIPETSEAEQGAQAVAAAASVSASTSTNPSSTGAGA